MPTSLPTSGRKGPWIRTIPSAVTRLAPSRSATSRMDSRASKRLRRREVRTLGGGSDRDSVCLRTVTAAAPKRMSPNKQQRIEMARAGRAEPRETRSSQSVAREALTRT
eukprot:scaffold2186_cov245-Pinguiococcus_pyrenoidosus.AAC.5